jgi:transposase
MKPPLFVRTLTPEERRHLERGRRSRTAFRMRRCQVVLASAAGQRPARIAQQVGCATQTVRNAIRAFNTQGMACLQEQSRRPKTVEPLFTEAKREQLRALLCQSPRQFGKPRSTWTLQLAAEVCMAEGVTPRLVSDETLRVALKRLGTSWRRAKHWITSPDPAYARKKSNGTA